MYINEINESIFKIKKMTAKSHLIKSSMLLKATAGTNIQDIALLSYNFIINMHKLSIIIH